MNENEPLLQKESSSSQNQPKNPEKKPSNPQSPVPATVVNAIQAKQNP